MSSFTSELKYEKYSSLKKKKKYYVITEEFSYAVGSLENPILIVKVPKGYVTDLTSIPWPFSTVFRPDGPWAKAAVIHDYLYTDFPHISKIIADSIFLEAMLVLKLPKPIAYLFFGCVRIYQSFKNQERIE